jgi:hypothetical protein
VLRAAVVRRRRAVVALGDCLAAVEREPVLRDAVLRDVEREDALREVERVPVDLRAVDGLRALVDLLVDLRVVVRRAAGLRAALVERDDEPVLPVEVEPEPEPVVDVEVVVVLPVLLVFSAMSGVSAPLGRCGEVCS